MEENENKNEETKNNFKTVQNPSSYKTYGTMDSSKSKGNFRKTFFVPFISGVLGCSLVLGVCFGVPSIKEKLLDNYKIIQILLYIQRTRYYLLLWE